MMLVYGDNYRPIWVMEYEADEAEGGRRRYDSGKMRDTEGGNSQLFKHGTTDCESQDNIFIKDAISQTDDVVTPMNVFKSTATSPKKNLDATKGLKRALEDDFVFDVNDNMLSSKTTKVVGGEAGQQKIVKVKLEK
ncbi:unnamed protein product [Lactuca virosa]|uniref:Uncharacterized protein n=1 Tax=Lactuca virosa TaxID=75947 RepID=A0AAU9MAJ9_9ASTR|nr:unnamed protein product [Lactuca virosa]